MIKWLFYRVIGWFQLTFSKEKIREYNPPLLDGLRYFDFKYTKNKSTLE